MNQFDELISELLRKYPEFKGQEVELRQFLEKLQGVKPSLILDPEFHSKLKTQLVEKIEKKEEKSSNAQGSWWKNISFSLSGILIGGIIMFIWQNLGWTLQEEGEETTLEDREVENILGFGNQNSSEYFPSLTLVGDYGGYGAEDAESETNSSETNLYQLEYIGEEDWMIEEKYLNIYQNQKVEIGIETTELLKVLGLEEIGSFSQEELTPQLFTFETNDGYITSFDITTGTLTLRYEESLYELGKKLRAKQIDYSQEEALNLALETLQELQIEEEIEQEDIQIEHYGENTSREVFNIYIPYKIEEEIIYAYEDHVYGINVSVEIINGTPIVRTVGNLRNMEWHSSDYPVASEEMVWEYLDQLELRFNQTNSDKVVIKLGTPEVRLYQISSPENSTETYVIPVYYFPVENEPNPLLNQYLIVPSVSDFLVLPRLQSDPLFTLNR